MNEFLENYEQFLFLLSSFVNLLLIVDCSNSGFTILMPGLYQPYVIQTIVIS